MVDDRSEIKASLAQLAWTCLYIGMTGYGGPAIVGYMKQVFVEKKKWVTEQEFITGLSLSQILPSATGVNTIEFLGYRVRGSWGAIIAPICFITPALVLMTVLSAIYFRFGKLHVVESLFVGLGAVVIALIINAAISMGKSAIKDAWAAGIAVLGFVIVRFLKAPIPAVVVVSAIAGLLIYRRKLAASVSVSDDASASPRSSRIYWVVLALFVGLVVGALMMTSRSQVSSLLLAILHVGVFTFGGGFMSIPLFQQQAVEVHHWLTNRQFLDGIAMGQITPGPVLITAAFIGYKVLGFWGALLAGLTIFSPGAVGMFVIAHEHERVSHLVWLQAMVKGIVAGFMGVLLSVIIRLGTQSITDWRTALMASVALVALLWKKIDPLYVIIAGAVISVFLFH